jgi:outer membrane cobalamin receptor
VPLLLAAAAGAQTDPRDLKTMSIEQLMAIDVTLATREPETLRRAAAAISVITGHDIRRAGVTTIARAVALADGVHVARFNNGTWAVSARGFNATSANKLLLMIDGRIEYSPLFSGAFWNMLDYALEDIDRNIVTRHSRDTQGTLLAFGTGNEDPRWPTSATAGRPAAPRIASVLHAVARDGVLDGEIPRGVAAKGAGEPDV